MNIGLINKCSKLNLTRVRCLHYKCTEDTTLKGKQTDPVNEYDFFFFNALSLGVAFSDSLVPPMINAPMNEFLFQQALWEKGFFRSLSLSFLTILLSSQCDLILSQSVKLIWTHLHVNVIKER